MIQACGRYTHTHTHTHTYAHIHTHIDTHTQTHTHTYTHTHTHTYTHTHIYIYIYILLPIPVAVRSRAWVCWECGFESRWENGCLSFLSAACCQVEVSASFVQSSPTECVVSKCDLGTSSMKRPCPNKGCWAMKTHAHIYIYILTHIWINHCNSNTHI